MTSADPGSKPAVSTPPSSFWTGFALGVGACAIFALVLSPGSAHLELGSCVAGLVLMIFGFMHLKRGTELALVGEHPTYWRGCLLVAFAAVSIAVPSLCSMFAWEDMCGGDPACIESFRA